MRKKHPIYWQIWLNSNAHQEKLKSKYDSDENIIGWDILSRPLRGLHHHSMPAVVMLSGTAVGGRSQSLGSLRAKRQPVASRDPPAPHVHFSPKPLKGIPWVLLCVHWPPRLWSRDPMCFHGIEVIILRSCRVMCLIRKFVWSFTGNS